MDNQTLYSLLFTDISEELRAIIKNALREKDYGMRDMLLCKIEKILLEGDNERSTKDTLL